MIGYIKPVGFLSRPVFGDCDNIKISNGQIIIVVKGDNGNDRFYPLQNVLYFKAIETPPPFAVVLMKPIKEPKI